MTQSKDAALDCMLGARKDAVTARRPLTPGEIRDAAATIHRHALDDADEVLLLDAVFGELRPTVPLGAGVRHPADCGCTACRNRREHRNDTSKGEA